MTPEVWWEWIPAGVVLVVALLWYLSYFAARLDRLHHRVEASRAALEAQLARRAAAAMEVAGVLDPATGLLLAGAAAEVLDGHDPAEEPRMGDGSFDGRVDEEAENDLTRALQAAFGDREEVALMRTDPPVAGLLDALAGACSRVQIARRFHNDAVSQAQRVRRKRVVRWARLAGRAEWPQMVEFDDGTPWGLAA